MGENLFLRPSSLDNVQFDAAVQAKKINALQSAVENLEPVTPNLRRLTVSTYNGTTGTGTGISESLSISFVNVTGTSLSTGDVVVVGKLSNADKAWVVLGIF
jgi:hypothetical protein